MPGALDGFLTPDSDEDFGPALFEVGGKRTELFRCGVVGNGYEVEEGRGEGGVVAEPGPFALLLEPATSAPKFGGGPSNGVAGTEAAAFLEAFSLLGWVRAPVLSFRRDCFACWSSNVSSIRLRNSSSVCALMSGSRIGGTMGVPWAVDGRAMRGLLSHGASEGMPGGGVSTAVSRVGMFGERVKGADVGVSRG